MLGIRFHQAVGKRAVEIEDPIHGNLSAPVVKTMEQMAFNAEQIAFNKGYKEG